MWINEVQGKLRIVLSVKCFLLYNCLQLQIKGAIETPEYNHYCGKWKYEAKDLSDASAESLQILVLIKIYFNCH
jgi:hypothetical protein